MYRFTLVMGIISFIFVLLVSIDLYKGDYSLYLFFIPIGMSIVNVIALKRLNSSIRVNRLKRTQTL